MRHLGRAHPLTEVRLPAARLARWVSNFGDRHGPTTLSTVGGGLCGVAQDGSRFTARLPFAMEYAGPASVSEFVAAVVPPDDWGVLLVRKGGFAVARLSGGAVREVKVGQRHVQGRTKAGGQSQQRFARRRDQQARVAYEAAVEHGVRLLGGTRPVVLGGDRAAMREVLSDPRLAHLEPVGPWLPVPDPRRRVLDAAIADAMSVSLDVTNL